MPEILIKTEDGRVLTIHAKDGSNGVDGKDGYTPIKDKDYFDGKDGRDGKDGESIKGEPGKDGRDGIDGITPDVSELITKTVKEVSKKIPKVEKIKKEVLSDIKYSDIKEVPNIQEVKTEIVQFVLKNVASRDYDLAELKDVSIINPQQGDTLVYSSVTKKFENGPSGGGGSYQILTTTGISDDLNLQFPFVSEPKEIVINGSSYIQTGGSYTWSWDPGTLIATLNRPTFGGSIYGRT